MCHVYGGFPMDKDISISDCVCVFLATEMTPTSSGFIPLCIFHRLEFSYSRTQAGLGCEAVRLYIILACGTGHWKALLPVCLSKERLGWGVGNPDAFFPVGICCVRKWIKNSAPLKIADYLLVRLSRPQTFFLYHCLSEIVLVFCCGFGWRKHWMAGGKGGGQQIFFMRWKVRRVSAEGGGHVSPERATQRREIGVVTVFNWEDDPGRFQWISRSCRQQKRLAVSAYFSFFYFHLYLSVLRFDSYFIERYLMHAIKLRIVSFSLP
jgi:hypothetical protein